MSKLKGVLVDSKSTSLHVTEPAEKSPKWEMFSQPVQEKSVGKSPDSCLPLLLGRNKTPEACVFGTLRSPFGRATEKVTPSFARFRQAQARRQNTPLAIPGVVAGQRPSFVPSHPSHHQS